MPTRMSALEREQAELLTLVDEILRLDWDAGATPIGPTPRGLCVQSIMSGNRIDEVIVVLPDHENVYVGALRDHFGHGTEIATCRRRVHRWATGGHEVLLDVCCDGGCHLIVD